MTSHKHLVRANAKLVKKLVDFSGVDEALVQGFVRFGKRLIKPETNCLDRPIFRAVLATYFDVIDESYVKRMYLKAARLNSQGKDEMEVEQFARYLCIFYTTNIDIKVDFIFSMYDIDGDGSIEGQEVLMLMKSCKCITDVDDAEREETYADLYVMLTDVLGMNDGPLCLESFRAKVYDNSLLLVLLGQLLPPREKAERFKELIRGKSNLEMMAYFQNIRSELLFELPKRDKLNTKYYPVVLDLP